MWVIAASQSCSFSFNKCGLFSLENTFLLKHVVLTIKESQNSLQSTETFFLSVLTWLAAADAASCVAVEVNSVAAFQLCLVVGYRGNSANGCVSVFMCAVRAEPTDCTREPSQWCLSVCTDVVHTGLIEQNDHSTAERDRGQNYHCD